MAMHRDNIDLHAEISIVWSFQYRNVALPRRESVTTVTQHSFNESPALVAVGSSTGHTEIHQYKHRSLAKGQRNKNAKTKTIAFAVRGMFMTCLFADVTL